MGSGYSGQHYPDAVFYNGYQGEGTSVKSLTIPLVIAIGGAAALVSLTYFGTTHFNDIKYAIEKLSDKVDTLSNNVNDRIQRLEVEVNEKTIDRYTRRDHDFWCARTETLNSDIGWKCADLQRPTKQNQTTQRGWAPTEVQR